MNNHKSVQASFLSNGTAGLLPSKLYNLNTLSLKVQTHLVDYHRSIKASVLSNGIAGLLQCKLDNLNALSLILIGRCEVVQQGQTPMEKKQKRLHLRCFIFLLRCWL
jgi:hypothetical protein